MNRFELFSVPGADSPWILKDYETGKTQNFKDYDEARQALREARKGGK